VPPQGADLVLTTDVPNGKLDVAVLDSLDVEALAGSAQGNNLGYGYMAEERGGRGVPMVGMVVTTSPSLSL